MVMNNLKSVGLKLDVGVLQFVPVNIYVNDGVFDFNIFCALDSGFSGFLSEKFFCRLYRRDIERLISYFDSHVKGLVAGELAESFTYVNLENDMHITALSGDAVDLSDGEFSIRILFNCGQGEKATTNTYFGFETVVDVSDLNKFCIGLKGFLAK